MAHVFSCVKHTSVDRCVYVLFQSYNNQDWLHSRSAREVRILCEYLEVENRLRSQKVLCTFLLFGSARARSPEQWEVLMADAQRKLEDPATRSQGEQEIARLKSIQWMCTYWTKIKNLSCMLTAWLQTDEARKVRVVMGPSEKVARTHQRVFALIGTNLSGILCKSASQFLPEAHVATLWVSVYPQRLKLYRRSRWQLNAFP